MKRAADLTTFHIWSFLFPLISSPRFNVCASIEMPSTCSGTRVRSLGLQPLVQPRPNPVYGLGRFPEHVPQHLWKQHDLHQPYYLHLQHSISCSSDSLQYFPQIVSDPMSLLPCGLPWLASSLALSLSNKNLMLEQSPIITLTLLPVILNEWFGVVKLCIVNYGRNL